MEILDKLNIKTDNYLLYEIALTHTSYSNEHSNVKNYERLEFLGDAVLELITSDYLYNNANLVEGIMTKLRASYVCENALYHYAKDLSIDKYIRVSNAETLKNNETIIADVFEAFLGAIYLDKGFVYAKDFVLKTMLPYINNHADFLKDYKSELQELVQTVKKSVNYEIVKETGPAHDKEFTCRVLVDGIVMGEGMAKSKKHAEQLAAKSALDKQVKIG